MVGATTTGFRADVTAVEAGTDDVRNAVREQQKRNFLATLLLSHGTPMILAGDEFGRSQMGNNNGYCQDSEISWVNWEGIPESGKLLLEFTQRLIAVRQAQPILRRENWRDQMGVTWLHPGGGEQTPEHWEDAGATTLGLLLSRDDLKGQDGVWAEVLMLFNPHEGAVPFVLPESESGLWSAVFDTGETEAETTDYAAGKSLEVPGRTLWLLT